MRRSSPAVLVEEDSGKEELSFTQTSLNIQIQFFVTLDIFLQSFFCPGWVLAAIQYRMNSNQISLDVVIDSKGKTLREASMIAKGRLMNSSVYKKGVNIGKQAVQEIRAESGFSVFIEMEALD